MTSLHAPEALPAYIPAHSFEHVAETKFPKNDPAFVAATCPCGLTQTRELVNGRTMAIRSSGGDLNFCPLGGGRSSTPGGTLPPSYGAGWPGHARGVAL